MKRKKRTISVPVVIIVLVTALCCLSACAADSSTNKMPDPEKVTPAAEGDYAIIDTHLHYLDFLQTTDGFEPLVKKMDETNVPYAILFGMAMAKEWDEDAPKAPTYYLSDDASCYFSPVRITS